MTGCLHRRITGVLGVRKGRTFFDLCSSYFERDREMGEETGERKGRCNAASLYSLGSSCCQEGIHSGSRLLGTALILSGARLLTSHPRLAMQG